MLSTKNCWLGSQRFTSAGRRPEVDGLAAEGHAQQRRRREQQQGAGAEFQNVYLR